MKIGFIGLGAMGRHMAANLQRAGHELQVYDLRRVDGFATGRRVGHRSARGLRSCCSPRCRVRRKSKRLPAKSAGAIRAGAAGSTSAPIRPSRAPHSRRDTEESSFLDAPVSGGPSGAEAASSRSGSAATGRFSKSTSGPQSHRRSTLLRRPDRRGHGGQARAQRRELRDPGGAGRDLHPRREGRRRAARAVQGAAPGRLRPQAHLRPPAPSISCPATTTRRRSRCASRTRT